VTTVIATRSGGKGPKGDSRDGTRVSRTSVRKVLMSEALLSRVLITRLKATPTCLPPTHTVPFDSQLWGTHGVDNWTSTLWPPYSPVTVAGAFQL
jgi:hypothetical protein